MDATVKHGDIKITMYWDDDHAAYPSKVTVEGPAIKNATFRELPFGTLIQEARTKAHQGHADKMLSRLVTRALHRGIDALDPRERRCLAAACYLLAIEEGSGTPAKDAAERLDVPYATIATWLTHARERGYLEVGKGKTGGTITDTAVDVLKNL